MKHVTQSRILSPHLLIVLLLGSALLWSLNTPVTVRAESLAPIQVYDVAPDTGAVTLNNLTLDGLTQYFGLGQQPMTVCVFRAARIAFEEVWAAPPNRTDIFVHTTNPTRGAADAIEFITRAWSRGDLLVEPIPGTTGVSMTVENWEFTFVRKSTSQGATIQVKAAVFPERLLELRAKVVGRQMTGQTPNATDLAEYQAKVKEFSQRLNTWPDDEVFNVTIGPYQIPPINPDKFISYYAPKVESEWLRLKGAEAENQALRTQLATAQSQVQNLTAESGNLKVDLSQAITLQYVFLITTVVFLVASVVLVTRRRK